MDGLPQNTVDRSDFGRLDRFKGKAVLPMAILSIAWIQELLDQLLFRGRWNLPLEQGGPFWGLFTAPFSHAGFGHLISNSLWFLPLSWLVLLKGGRDYLAVWIGWLEKRPFSLLLSIGCLLMYGGLLPALVPFLSPVGVSWIGHASGFAGGLLAAWAVQRP